MLLRFKDRKLDANDRKFIKNVEKYGWTVMNIKDEPGKTGWSYTVGLFEHYSHPEVIIFGMEVDNRHRILNWIGDNAKKGNTFTAETEHDWVLNNYNCWSKPVQKKWYCDLLGYARWFYRTQEEDDNFPCVQAFWPDKHGHYPWQHEYGFSVQPLLYESGLVGSGMMHYASDQALSEAEWPFSCEPHTRTYVSRCVVEGGAPIVRVYHSHDGDWQFVGPVEDPNVDGCKISCFHCIVERDPSVKVLAGLPVGHCALRESPAHNWEWQAYEASEG